MRAAAVSWVFMLLTGARSAEAICVVDNQGPCYRYWHTGMVLLGEVRERTPIGKQVIEGYDFGSNFQLRVSVLEAYRGLERDAAEVIVNAYEGECGYAPQVGARVFIYANRGKDGAFWLSMYSSPFEHADEDLEYARLAVRQAASALVYGQVEHREDPVLDASAFTPLEGVRVRAYGPGFDVTVSTDAEGNYAIPLPGAGTYQVEVFAPRGMADRDVGPTTVEIANPQECLRVDYQLFTNGRIRGVVVDESSGLPIPNLVIRAGDDLRQSKTDRTGAFDIGPLSKGDYVLEARTGSGSVRLLPSLVHVSSGKSTVVRPLVARLSRPLSAVVFDLTGLDDRGWVELLGEGIFMQLGREKEATVALERGESFEVIWSHGDNGKRATFTVDADVTRVRLSALTWRPAQ